MPANTQPSPDMAPLKTNLGSRSYEFSGAIYASVTMVQI